MSSMARRVAGAGDTSDAELIALAAEALNPHEIAPGVWTADVGAAVEAEDGEIHVGACVGGELGFCAEQAALGQLVSDAAPIVKRVVAVWRDPNTDVLHVLPPCGRCRELLRHLSQDNLETIVILGPDHRVPLRVLLPFHGWHAEPAEPQRYGPGSARRAF